MLDIGDLAIDGIISISNANWGYQDCQKYTVWRLSLMSDNIWFINFQRPTTPHDSNNRFAQTPYISTFTNSYD